jgi:hypothetical protein
LFGPLTVHQIGISLGVKELNYYKILAMPPGPERTRLYNAWKAQMRGKEAVEAKRKVKEDEDPLPPEAKKYLRKIVVCLAQFSSGKGII